LFKRGGWSQGWTADDRSAVGALPFEVTEERLGSGREIAVAISVAQSVQAQARTYISERLPEIGTLLTFTIPGGAGGRGVAGGAHAASLAEQISNGIRSIKAPEVDAVVHVFAAAPNSFLYFLGQQHQGIAPCVVCELDFDRAGNRSYHPSFNID
jgi:hypothetical protein